MKQILLRIFALCLCCVLLVGLISCTKDKNEDDGGKESESISENNDGNNNDGGNNDGGNNDGGNNDGGNNDGGNNDGGNNDGGNNDGGNSGAIVKEGIGVILDWEAN